MGQAIDIKIDEAQMQNIRQLLRDIPRALPRVISRAINRTVAPVRTYMARQLVKPLNVEMTTIRKAQRKAGIHILGYYKKAPSTRFKIADMKSNIKFQRATFKVWRALIWIKRYKGQEAKTSKEPSFVAQMPSGHISIFRRLGAARLPIADLIRRLMVENFKGIFPRIKAEAQQRLERNINDQVKLALVEWKGVPWKAA